jgi:LacI family transcriptional regulator
MAKVSIGTVDRVIHKRPGVSKKTQERIEKIMETHNFQINKTAQTLALNKTYRIGVLIPESQIELDFWHGPKRGIEKATEEINIYRTSCTSFYFNHFDATSFVNAFEKLVAGDFDAVLLTPIFFNETKRFLPTLEKENIAYLFINTELKSVNNISYLGQNAIESGKLAAKMMSLLVENSDEILLIKVRKESDHHIAIDERIQGFTSYFLNKNMPNTIHELLLTDIKNQEIVNTFILRELTKNDKIRGIYVPSSYVNLVAKCLKESELEDIKLIGYDLNEENKLHLKNETIDFLIDQDAFSQGYNGIRTLFDFIANDKTPKKNQYTPIQLLTKENIL